MKRFRIGPACNDRDSVICFDSLLRAIVSRCARSNRPLSSAFTRNRSWKRGYSNNRNCFCSARTMRVAAGALSWNAFALTIERHWTLLIVKTNTGKLLCTLVDDFTSRLTDVDSSPRQDERATIYEAVITFRIEIPSSVLAIVRRRYAERLGDLVQDRQGARTEVDGDEIRGSEKAPDVALS